ncbi:MAG: hypothetical protein OJJ21_14530 [Ferrovibrio sp.]|uniref:hypothetical protein n=1 Tax=Ferrovibrio sp. TaxID=1917215 RepID=UPI002601E10A|nr:hypothetical protein [Ferrovibrio sp.]MCW0234813.1 hypothetical protein [Ferrovibrio sp.]
MSAGTSPWEVVNRHVEAALAEAGAAGIPAETVASNLIAEAVRILKTRRQPDDIRAELQFAIENLQERDYEFMRP